VSQTPELVKGNRKERSSVLPVPPYPTFRLQRQGQGVTRCPGTSAGRNFCAVANRSTAPSWQKNCRCRSANRRRRGNRAYLFSQIISPPIRIELLRCRSAPVHYPVIGSVRQSSQAVYTRRCCSPEGFSGNDPGRRVKSHRFPHDHFRNAIEVGARRWAPAHPVPLAAFCPTYPPLLGAATVGTRPTTQGQGVS